MFRIHQVPTFKCAHCGVVVEETERNSKTRRVEFGCENPDSANGSGLARFIEGRISVIYHRCPICHKYSVRVSSEGDSYLPQFSVAYPPESSVSLPSYIPLPIQSDYYEACSISDLSPKASATLARRCLQGMIRDFWGIRRKNLYTEISELKDKVPPDQWRVIDGLRRIGNIGAHMEADANTIVDIDPDEAKKLLRLIELLFTDWYEQRHNREVLYQEIIEIDQDKQSLRKAHTDS